MFSVLAFMLGCKPSTPSQYIQPDEIVDILVDYHLSRAMAQIQPNYDEQNYCRALYWNAVNIRFWESVKVRLAGIRP